MRVIILAATLSLLSSATSSATTLADFSSLRGCWSAMTDYGPMQESFSPVTGGMIYGWDQITKGGVTLGFDLMTLSTNGTDVVFNFSESGAGSIPYQLTAMSGTGRDFSATFTNKSQAAYAITLTMTGGKNLLVNVQGNVAGNPNGFQVSLDRVSDTAECPSR